jgi:hypothetical protein
MSKQIILKLDTDKTSADIGIKDIEKLIDIINKSGNMAILNARNVDITLTIEMKD